MKLSYFCIQLHCSRILHDLNSIRSVKYLWASTYERNLGSRWYQYVMREESDWLWELSYEIVPRGYPRNYHHCIILLMVKFIST